MPKIYTRQDNETLDDVIMRVVRENSDSAAEATALEAAIREAISDRSSGDGRDTPASVAKGLGAAIKLLSAVGLRILTSDDDVLHHKDVQARLMTLAQVADALAMTCKAHLLQN